MNKRRIRRTRWKRRKEKADQVRYEVVEETYRRPDGTRFKIEKILEKDMCKIVGKRIIELSIKQAKFMKA